jgi:hypothetical protein
VLQVRLIAVHPKKFTSQWYGCLDLMIEALQPMEGHILPSQTLSTASHANVTFSIRQIMAARYPSMRAGGVNSSDLCTAQLHSPGHLPQKEGAPTEEMARVWMGRVIQARHGNEE